MKLFQRLLVAPAALGLMAPIAANADVTSISSDSDLSSEVIEARVDGVEAQLGDLYAGQFSSSTKMSGKAAFISGQVDNNVNDTDELHTEYMFQLNLNTSFTGKDNLYTRIKTGNSKTSGTDVTHFGDKGQGTYLSAASGKDSNNLTVDKIWYQFPVGDSFTAWVGPLIENYYMLASAPSIYKPVTKQFALGGNGSAYGSSTSPGFGIAWTQQKDDPSDARWEVSANYAAKGAADSTDEEGLFGDDTESFILTKVGYGSPRWQLSLATAFKDGWNNDGYFQSALATASPNVKSGTNSTMTAYAVRGYWKPETTGSLPEIQVGIDWADIDNSATGEPDATSGWMVGLGWKDLFIDGNRGGFAYGSRQSATSIVGGGSDPEDDNRTWEAYYTFKVNDGVSITPAVFASSDVTNAAGTVTDTSGAVVLTEFKF